MMPNGTGRSILVTQEGAMTTAIPAAELDARFSDPNASATPWERVEHTIDGAELFWISTVRSDGRPHVTPLPAVWVDGSLYFCTGADEQKCVNLARNANCVLTTGNNAWKSGLDVVRSEERRVGKECLTQCRSR